ncbi:uncharacterized protein [Gossypium hirsutum]|uniref:Uncharacterized protein n=1 Tax=Gossypium hirsutum TaxID=3635 RepID=A0A1U8MWK8_GOSHI|nr:uncharacterized protein LOC107942087 [Gossypium hirsutum]
MIENAIRTGKIDAGESSRRSASKKKENEVNNASYSKTITVNQPRKVVVDKQGADTRQNKEKPQFTPIPISYKELYQKLFNAHVVSPFYLEPLQPPYPKWYDANAQCDYPARIVGHSIEHCTAFKKLVERLISMGVVKLDDSSKTENLLPDHNRVNMIGGSMDRRIKGDIAEVKFPLRGVWRKMVERGLFVSKRVFEGVENYCEFHQEKGHEIQKCTEFKALVQGMMDTKEMEFYEEVKEEESICTSESTKVPRVVQPVVIISRPKNNEVRTPVMPRIIIKKPVTFSYKDSKRVSWNYECNTTVPGKKTAKDQSVSADPEPVKGKAIVMEQKRKLAEPMPSINEPVKEEEAVEFLKFLKHSKYNVVKQLHKQPARTSILALLLNSKVHRSALMKVLNETYVANDISVNKLDWLVNNISADNFIFFNDDEIPLGGTGSTKSLHITT